MKVLTNLAMGGTSSIANKPVANSKWVRLNVGGKRFQTTKSTLSQYPKSFLARLVNGELASEKDESGAYLIDANPDHFNTILNYLRRGVLNFDGNEKTAKDLMSEADFYNIVPLVDDIRKAMGAVVIVREKMVIVSKGSYAIYIGQSRVYGYLSMSEKREDYEVLQALRQKIPILTRKTDGHSEYYITSNHDDTWMNIELTLRSFGFIQELNDDMYSKIHKHGHWKFVRTTPE